MKIKYKCEICKEEFKFPKNLAVHIDLKHKELGQINYYKKFISTDPKCGICLVCGKPLETDGRKFKFSYGFRRHVHRKCSSATLEHWKLMFGEKEAEERWKVYCNKQSETNTFEYKHKKYGWTKEQFDEYNKSRATTLKNQIAKYGVKEGTERFNKYCELQKYVGCTKEYFIEKFGEEEGIKKFEEVNKSKAITLDNMIKLYGEKEGTERFYKAKEHNNFYSKVSKQLFDTIQEQFKNRKLYYAENEFGIWDKNSKKLQKYDLTDNENKIIIEFNGLHFHAKSQDDPNFYNPFSNITAKEQWELDQNKKACAEQKGYKIYYIWEDEYTNNKEETIKKCINILNGEQ